MKGGNTMTHESHANLLVYILPVLTGALMLQIGEILLLIPACKANPGFDLVGHLHPQA